MLNKIKSKFQQISHLSSQLHDIEASLHSMKESLGRIERRQIEERKVPCSLAATEFKVFSQWGEDGIIQHLIREVSPSCRVFVEFGVETYREANTRFLLTHNNWAGLVIDGFADNIIDIRNQDIYWQRNLKAIHAFVTAENINDILKSSGISGEIGLLSIDVDGNDFWIWKAIDCISPAIVVCEYNFRFGPERAVTIPYDANFVRSESHHSMIYYGASLKAINWLAKLKGYVFVGCNSAGNNAFFIREDLKPPTLQSITVEDGFVRGQYRETRYQDGTLAYLSHEEELEILSNLPLVNIEE